MSSQSAEQLPDSYKITQFSGQQRKALSSKKPTR